MCAKWVFVIWNLLNSVPPNQSSTLYKNIIYVSIPVIPVYRKRVNDWLNDYECCCSIQYITGTVHWLINEAMKIIIVNNNSYIIDLQHFDCDRESR